MTIDDIWRCLRYVFIYIYILYLYFRIGLAKLVSPNMKITCYFCIFFSSLWSGSWIKTQPRKCFDEYDLWWWGWWQNKMSIIVTTIKPEQCLWFKYQISFFPDSFVDLAREKDQAEVVWDLGHGFYDTDNLSVNLRLSLTHVASWQNSTLKCQQF